MRPSTDEVVAPNMIRPFWTQSDAVSIVVPQPPSGSLFLRHFQPLPPPAPLHSVPAHRPSCDLQQRRDLFVPVAPVLTGQHACGVDFPFATATSICRKIVTICSGFYLCIGILYALLYEILAREGEVAPIHLLNDFGERRRMASLAAQMLELDIVLTDAAVAMFERLTGQLFTRSKNKQDQSWPAGKARIGRLIQLFGGTIDAMMRAREQDQDPFAVLDAEIGWTRLLQSRDEIAAFGDLATDVSAHWKRKEFERAPRFVLIIVIAEALLRLSSSRLHGL